MPRPRPSKGKILTEEVVKYSVLVPKDIDEKVDEIYNLRRLSKSELLREILLDNIEQYRARALDYIKAAAKRDREQGRRPE